MQAAALALGYLFVSLYGGVLGDLKSLLFGNLLGVSDGQVLALGAVALIAAVAMAAIGRPLLFEHPSTPTWPVRAACRCARCPGGS